MSGSQFEQGAHIYLRCIELHPLALEDVLANRGEPARSKTDYYSKHLSLHVQCHTVQSEDEESLQLLHRGRGVHEHEGNDIPSGRARSYGAYSDMLGYVRGDGGKPGQLYI